MKKNILKATLVVAFALIAGMNVYNAQQSDIMSVLVFLGWVGLGCCVFHQQKQQKMRCFGTIQINNKFFF